DGAKLLRVIYGYEFSLEYRRKKVVFKDLLFQTRARQYYASLRKSPDNYSLEKRILRFFINLKREMLKTEVLCALEKLWQEMKQMKLQPENIYIKSMLKFVQFEKWMDEFKKKLNVEN